MNWSTILPSPWKPNLAITEDSIKNLVEAAPFELSVEYLDLLRWADGGEGTLGDVYFNLWSSFDAIKLNEGYKIRHFLPNVWAVGDDSSHFYALEISSEGTFEAIRFPTGFMHPTSINVRLPCLRTMFSQLAVGELF